MSTRALASAILASALISGAAWSGCAKSLDALAPFPCASDHTCPDGFSCNGQDCVAGTGGGSTTGCATGMELCDGGCVDTQTSTNDCGGCGNVCGAGESCQNGLCKSGGCTFAAKSPECANQPGFPYACPSAPECPSPCFDSPVACNTITVCPGKTTCNACLTCGKTYDCSVGGSTPCH